MIHTLNEKIKKIKFVITDVDGVLTDGGMYYSIKGDIMKKFNAKDGMGVSILKRNGISTAIITKEKNKIVLKWASKMKIIKVYQGVVKKEDVLKKICKSYNLSEKNIAYIGDDVNDLEILKKVGFSVSPRDANHEIRKIVDHICKNSGGNGAFRELCDLIVTRKFGNKKKLY